ncbi:MAG: PLP-dependent transferase [Acutalibacteraceae bacterium]|nr:PLP-dependent transferase [Acutalibacteraceae bacterium]
MTLNFNTTLLHGKLNSKTFLGETTTPIFQVNAFSHESPEKLEKVFNNKAAGYAYSRIGNPTIAAFENKIAELEHGIGAVACSSGMAAITMTLLNILSSGDEVIAASGLFGGTIDLFGDLSPFGITTRFVNHISVENIESLITDKTKAVFGELIGNPALDIVDIEKVSAYLHKKGIPLIIDSTTATPYLVNPLNHGADVVVHSSSKYINGSGTAISGIIVDSGKFNWRVERYPSFLGFEKFGKFSFLSKLRNGIWRNIGACLSPFNAYLNNIGLETLGLRMERVCSTTKRLADFFESVDGVTVNYPGLPSSPYFDLNNKYLNGKGGAIITIRTGSKENAFKIINNLKIPLIATNIGDVRTLVIHPYSTIYAHASHEQKVNAGVFEDTIRISVGIEDAEDLIYDFKQAIDKTRSEN